MDAQPAPFGELLRSAWAHFNERRQVILLAALIFSVLSMLGQGMIFFEDSANPVSGAMIALSVVAGIISIIAGLVSSVYYIIAVVKKDTSVGAIMSKSIELIPQFIGLVLLILVKTYGWLVIVGVLIMGASYWNTMLAPVGVLIMAVGFACSVVFAPRYMLASTIWQVEGKGVRASINRSYQVTQGYWGKIVGNMILLTLCFIVVMIGVGIVVSIFGAMAAFVGGKTGSFLVSGLITGFISQCYAAFMQAFLLKMTATIITHPRAAIATVVTPAKSAVKTPKATVKTAAKKKK